MNTEFTFYTKSLSLIGEGRRRQCYRFPGEALCVKFYRNPTTLPKNTRKGVRFDITLGRHFRTLNINYREWRYHRGLKQRLPADLLALFPEHIEPVYCATRGWGVLESLILNADGTLPRRILEELTALSNPVLALRLYQESERLFDRLEKHSVCFFDLPNVLVQWTGTDTFRLRIVDFEPTSRALVPGLILFRPYVRRKIRRRSRRYLMRMKKVLSAKGVPAVCPSGEPPLRTVSAHRSNAQPSLTDPTVLSQAKVK
jgi:hypothetical protein